MRAASDQQHRDADRQRRRHRSEHHDPAAQLTVNAGQAASFTVVASGTAPSTYQWQKNISGTWTNVKAATSPARPPTLSFLPVAADAGSYRVIVTNSAGSATSNTGHADGQLASSSAPAPG